MSQLFQEVKARVTAREAAYRYGMPIRGSWALCPFHDDTHASLHFYEKGYKCFSCNASGSVIDLTAHLLGLPPLEAAKRLNEDFGLGIPLEGSSPSPRNREPDRRELARQRYEQWREEFVRKLARTWRLCNTIEVRDPWQMEPWEAWAVSWMDIIEDWMLTLADGTRQEQQAIFKTREDIDRKLESILQKDLSLLENG